MKRLVLHIYGDFFAWPIKQVHEPDFLELREQAVPTGQVLTSTESEKYAILRQISFQWEWPDDAIAAQDDSQMSLI